MINLPLLVLQFGIFKMKYIDARQKIKSGDVLAWSEGGWGSIHDMEVGLVRMVTQSEYAHVGMALDMGSRLMVVEAVVPYIRIFPLSRLTPFYWMASPFIWTPEAEEILLNRVGLPYSKWEAIRAFFTTDTKGTKVWECAKLVNATLETFDSKISNIHDTPTETVRYMMDELNCPLIYVED